MNYIDPKGLADFSATGYCWGCSDTNPPGASSNPGSPAVGGGVANADNDRVVAEEDAGIGLPDCPPVPNQPSSANLDANIAEALKVHSAAEAMRKAGDRPSHALITEVTWLISKVNTGREWDYKQGGDQYREFGNFNFGAVAAALA